MTDDKVSPIPGEPECELASAVFPAARKISGTMLAPMRATLERLVINLTEAGLQAYRDAASARDAGDTYGAGLLNDAARRALDMAREQLEVIEAL